MKFTKLIYAMPLIAAVTMTSCVVYPEGRPVSSVGVSYRTYDVLPRGYVGDAYFYGGRYYSGGRYENGRYYSGGRSYSDRYYYNGQYYYGGHHEHHAAHGSSQHTGYVQVRRTRY